MDRDALIETIWLTPAGELRAWTFHLARLDRSLRALGWPRPALEEVPRRCAGPGPARVRLIADEAGSLTVERTPPSPALARRRCGIDAVLRAPPPGAHPALKLASQAALHAACAAAAAPAEPLYATPDGEILEGATWNVFALLGGVWQTPPADGRLLPGVTRERLLRAARDAGSPMREAPLSVAMLRRADAIVATNALLPLAPVCSLEGLPLSVPCGALDLLRGLLGEPTSN